MKLKSKERKAYWTQKTHLLCSDEYICSACGHVSGKAYKQCPSCESDMSKSKYDLSWIDEAEMMDFFFGD